MRVLLTGGMGFIGSHTAVSLLEAGHEPILYDNLSNADRSVVDRIGRITGHTPTFIEGDIRDGALLKQVLRNEHIEAVIHFAGLKAVGESVGKPLEYFDNNVSGTIKLLEAMRSVGVKRLIFSSSSTVYGTPQHLPLTEAEPTGEATNPYGRTKIHIEEILADLCRSDSEWSVVCLRYFNPIGAHPSGLIGEDPNGIPNNLLPYISQVAIGKLPQLSVFGSDYDTHDGTGVRDYIHVVDLAIGHLKALNRHENDAGLHIYNLGTGTGYSVLDMVKAFEQANNIKIPYRLVARRPGDIATCYSDPSLAAKELNWTAERGLEQMMKDTWNWQKK